MGSIARIFAALTLLALAGSAAATNFVVTNAASTPDANPGNNACNAMGGGCSLRAAIMEANAHAGNDSITFQAGAATASITLTVALPPITQRLDIDGANASGVGGRVDINGNQMTGAFDFTYTTNANGSTIKNLVIRNFNDDGITISGHGYTVDNNLIGVMPDGQSASANHGHGLTISASISDQTFPVNFPPLPTLPSNLAGVAAYTTALIAALSALEAPNTITSNVISGNFSNGIEIFSQYAGLNIISNNKVGTDIDGFDAISNGTNAGGFQGLRMTAGTYGNVIGPGNIFSGNSSSGGCGIAADNGAVVFPNLIAGNLIGIGLNPLSDIGNVSCGIHVDTKPDTDGTNPDNPTGYALFIGPANVVSDNKGTMNMGDLDDANGVGAGILVTGTSSKVRIFGNVVGLGQFPIGVPVFNLNYGNAGDGIVVTTSDVEIGGSQVFEFNIITGNARHGITVNGASTAANVSIKGNFIGVPDPTMLNVLGLGNGGDGIFIKAAGSLTIGGPGSFDDNVIAANGRNGIAMRNGSPLSGWANLIQRNQIYANAQTNPLIGVGIDLEHDKNVMDFQPDPAGPDPNTNYANFGQNQPHICDPTEALPPPPCIGGTGPSYAGGATSLQWTLLTAPSRSYRVEFFSLLPDGMTFLNEQMIMTDAAGLPTGAGCSLGRCTSSVTPMAALDTRGSQVIMTVTDLTIADVPPLNEMPAVPQTPSNNTSEFSNAVKIPDPGEIRFVNMPANIAQTAAENAGTVTFQVERVNGSDGAVSADLQVAAGGSATGGGVDYSIMTATANWADGESGIKNVTVSIVNDTIDEPNETANFQLGNLVGTPAPDLVAPSTATLTITDDDPTPTIAIDDVTLAEGNAGTTMFTFTVTVTGQSGQNITVTAASSNGSATLANNDYQQLAATPLTFLPGGAATQQVTVLVNGDMTNEPNETFNVDLTNATNATISDNQGVGTITNDDIVPPTFAINDVTQAETNAGTTTFTFTVTRGGDLAGTVTVDAATSDGSATTADSDYVALATTPLSFGPNVTTQQVMVTVNGDTKFEPNETFNVNLTNNSAGTMITDPLGVGTITNDDGQPTISINDVSLAEGNSGTTMFTFTVTLSNASAQTVTVTAASSNGSATLANSDYQQLAATTVTFTPGGALTQPVTVLVNGDMTPEPNETFNVDLTAPSNATTSDAQGVGTISNDDGVALATFTINDVTQVETNAGTTTFTFTVTRGGDLAGTVTVDASTSDGSATTADSDYVALATTPLSFGPNVTTQQVMVTVNGDTKFEPDETFNVNLGNNSAGAVINDNLGVGTITNDDLQPTISINDLSLAEGNAGTTMFTFTVTLSNASSQTVTVSAASSDGSATLANTDYQQLNATTLTFMPGGALTQPVTVLVNGDMAVEPNEAFNVDLTNPSNATFTDAQGAGTIVNDDGVATAMFSINDVTQAETNAGTTTFTFTVTRGGDLTGTVTVDAASVDSTATVADGDYVALATTPLSFGPNVTTQQVMVTVNGDTKFEPNEAFFVNLTNAGAGSSIVDGQGVGTINNDDGQPTISINDLTLAEGNAGTTMFTFTVTLSNASSQTVTVSAASSDGSATLANTDYQQLNATTVTFTPGGALTQPVTVLVNGDLAVEPNETFNVDLTNATNATTSDNQGVGTITNDDVAAGASFSINDVTLAEGNAGTTAFNFTVTRGGDLTGTVTVDVATSDGSATLANNDYAQVTTTTLTFGPNVTTQPVTVNVNGDVTVEPTEAFNVNLTNASAGSSITDGLGVGTITNDDVAAGASFTINDVTLAEGNAGTTAFNFTVTRGGDLTGTVTVDVGTSDGSATLANNDYAQVTTTTLTFGPNVTTQPVTVNVNGDVTVEPTEAFNVNLTNASAGSSITDALGVGTITNDDVAALAPDLSIVKTHVGNFTQGQVGATYTITVSNAAGAGPTDGSTVTVTDTVPAGLTATAISGTGWTCTQPAGPCTRNDVLAAGASYPVLTLTVNVSGSAPGLVTNTANVVGGGDVTVANGIALNPTTVLVAGQQAPVTAIPALSAWGLLALMLTMLGLGARARRTAR